MPRFTPSTLMTAVGLAALALAGTTRPAEAQFGRRLKNAIKHTAEDRAVRKAVDTENKAIDGATSGGRAAPAASWYPPSTPRLASTG